MLTHRFDDALDLASELHRCQVRKGTRIPYLSHLLSVSALVLEHGGDEDQAIAGLLHDAVEDAGGRETATLIRTRFGDRVADMVLACSDSMDQEKEAWELRKTRYIASLASKSEDALLVTACDMLHNARAILNDLSVHGSEVFERFTAKQDGTLWYYRSLADAIAARRAGALADRLDEVVSQLETRAAEA